MEKTVSEPAGGHRHSIRLKHRDYSLPGLYFVTICTHQKRCFLGHIVQGRLALNSLGQIARECWVMIPNHFAQVHLHEFVLMPNHLHGILSIVPLVGAQHRCALSWSWPEFRVQPGSLGAIIRSFKAIVTRRAHEELAWNGPVWERNYFERVLRDGQEFSDASRYIAENPRRWEFDRENLRRSQQ
jgi:putative transposase